jgi:ABC-type transport system involved in multi-copper enzyme maturation permease subunit
MHSTPTLSGAQRARPSFVGIVRSELAKLTWLRSIWIMTMLVIVFTTFLYLLVSVKDRQLLQSDLIKYTYDDILSTDFQFFQAFTGYFALVITVFAVGVDYQFGTLRVILGRGVGRSQFLLGKIVALFIFAILVQVCGVIFNSIVLSALISMQTGSLDAMGFILAHFSSIFVQYFLYLTLNMWISILLATFLTVISRSLTFGMAATLLWFPFDTIASILFSQLSGSILPKLAASLLGPNLNMIPHTVISQRISSSTVGQQMASVNGLHTVGVTLVYATIFLVVAMVVIQRRDVQS